MYLNLLSDSLSLGDRLNYMWVGVLVGMLVVFSVLALLWLILEAFGAVARKGKKADKATPAPSMVAPAPAPVSETASTENDEEIVAAITAALAVYMEEAKVANPSINGFRVVSFKKVGSAAHWNQK